MDGGSRQLFEGGLQQMASSTPDAKQWTQTVTDMLLNIVREPEKLGYRRLRRSNARVAALLEVPQPCPTTINFTGTHGGCLLPRCRE